MHELSLIENIIKIIENLAGEKQLTEVSKIFLQIGALRQVVPEFMQFAFTSAARATIMAGAKLQIEIIPIKIRCGDCGREFIVDELTYFCPTCESSAIIIIAGKEIVIESIEGKPKDDKK